MKTNLKIMIFKRISIKKRFLIYSIIITLIYLFLLGLNIYKIDNLKQISEDIFVVKNENLILNNVNRDIRNISKNVDTYFIADYDDVFSLTINELSSVTENLKNLNDNSNLKGYESIIEENLFFIKNNKGVKNTELNIKKGLVYENIEKIEIEINELLNSNFIQIENLTIYQKKCINKIHKNLIYLGLIIPFLILIIVYFLFKSIIKPINLLMTNVNYVTKGNLDVKVAIENQDEIGELSKLFNEMTRQLKISRNALEKKIKIRTQELENSKVDLNEKVLKRTFELENLKGNLEQIITDRTTELNTKISELEKMNKFMVNRELEIIKLKKENKSLLQENKKNK